MKFRLEYNDKKGMFHFDDGGSPASGSGIKIRGRK